MKQYILFISLIDNDIYGLIYYNEEIPFLFAGSNMTRCIEDFIDITYNLYFNENKLRNILKTNRKLLSIIKTPESKVDDEENYNIVYIDKLELQYHNNVRTYFEGKNKLQYEKIDNIVFYFPYLEEVRNLKSQIYNILNIKELRSILKDKKVKKLTKYRSKIDIIDKLSMI